MNVTNCEGEVLDVSLEKTDNMIHLQKVEDAFKTWRTAITAFYLM
jgi:hypothetical protein